MAGKLMLDRESSIRITYVIPILVGIILTLFRIFRVRNIEPIFGAYDSSSYFDFVFAGGIRMPLITFIFSTIDNNYAIVIFQTFIAGLAWTLLCVAVLRLNKNILVNMIALILIFSLGYSKQVVYLDSCIDAESLNISFLVILFSAFLFDLKKSSNLTHSFILLSCILFAGVKSINGITVLMPLVYLLVKILRSNKFKSNPIFSKVLAALTILTSLLSIYLFSQIQVTKLYNTSALINSRLWEVPEWRDYTLTQNFPVEARSTFVRFTNRNLGSPPDTAVGNLPEYLKWFESGGSDFLMKFMIVHPSYTLLGPLVYPALTKEFNFENTIWRGAADGILNFESRQHQLAKIWPESYLFWSKDRSTGYIQLSIFLCIIGISLLSIRQATKADSRLNNLIVFLLSFAFLISYCAWWFGSTPSDLGRHQFPFAIALRIIFVFSLTKLLTRLVKTSMN